MTPEKLKALEQHVMWLTLVSEGSIPATLPIAGTIAKVLAELLAEQKGPDALRAVVARVFPEGQVPPGVWPSTNAAIKTLCDIWIARWGAGSAPGDVIRNAVLALKKDGAPWDSVVRSFQRYVDTVDNTYASPYAWRKKWKSYDPETPEHDHESAQILDSYDRQDRTRRRGQGGMQHITSSPPRLPPGRPRG